MSHRKQVDTLLLLVTVTFLTGTTLQAQSLGELAKKEKERRAQTPAKVRVLSNSDVAKFQKGAVTTGVYGQEQAKAVTVEKLPDAAVAPTAPQEAAAPAKDEKYWRDRFKELTNNVSAAENRSVLAQLQLNELRNRFYRESDGFYRETIQKDIDLKLREVDRLEKDVKEAQKQLEDFKTEARRSNVPPGWLR